MTLRTAIFNAAVILILTAAFWHVRGFWGAAVYLMTASRAVVEAS